MNATELMDKYYDTISSGEQLMSVQALARLLNNEQNVQGSDTTDDDSSTTAKPQISEQEIEELAERKLKANFAWVPFPNNVSEEKFLKTMKSAMVEMFKEALSFNKKQK